MIVIIILSVVTVAYFIIAIYASNVGIRNEVRRWNDNVKFMAAVEEIKEKHKARRPR